MTNIYLFLGFITLSVTVVTQFTFLPSLQLVLIQGYFLRLLRGVYPSSSPSSSGERGSPSSWGLESCIPDALTCLKSCDQSPKHDQSSIPCVSSSWGGAVIFKRKNDPPKVGVGEHQALTASPASCTLCWEERQRKEEAAIFYLKPLPAQNRLLTFNRACTVAGLV